MKHKHMFSLLDQSFTTVLVTFSGNMAPVPLRPGNYTAEVKAAKVKRNDRTGREYLDVDWEVRDGPIPTPWNGDDNRQGYIYKVPKAWGIKEDDFLVVNSPNSGLSVVKVLRADDVPDIDIDSNHDYKWAVCKVEMDEHFELVRREKQFGEQMLEVERVKQRENLVSSFRDSLPEGSEARRLFDQTTQPLAPPEAPFGGAVPPAPGSEA